MGNSTMPSPTGTTLDALDSPQLLIDLTTLDGNLDRMHQALASRGIDLRVHFKSLKCAGLAKYLAERGVTRFLCAKLNEAEVLADAGLTDLFIANQIIGSIKLGRLARLAGRAHVRVCVDDAANVAALSHVCQAHGCRIGVLIEVDIGMGRCGVEPGDPALDLARLIIQSPGLEFIGLQGYDGHLQMLPDEAERRARAEAGLDRLLATRRVIEGVGLPVGVVTGAGTGTWEFAAAHPAITEIQPGSFLLMDCAYHTVRPEFGCALSILATVVSRRPGWYVLDAGSKAISKDFGMPVIKSRPQDRVVKLAEEHTRVDTDDSNVKISERYEVLPAHCCATMNLHRACVAVRANRIEAFWPIEASGRYD
jgi:D-serine deaminase-like pyridoxal phosphate-dependent protein